MDKKLLDLNGVKVYTRDDVVDAISIIGQDVYMSDTADFKNYYKCRLTGVRAMEHNAFPFVGNDEHQSIIYKYCILAEDAKFKEEKEKKLRPFKSVFEFNRETGCEKLGDIITFKMINGKFDETCIFTGYRFLKEDNQTIILLGGMGYTFKELKEDYLYLKDGEFIPFGIEE